MACKKKEGFQIVDTNEMNSRFQDEAILVDYLNNFNKKYADFINCKYSNPQCPTLGQKQIDMEAAKQLVVNFNGQPFTKSGINNTYLSPSEYDSSFKNLVKMHADVVNTRADLDLKLKDLNSTSDSKYADNKNQLDSSVYKNILMTILATSILYFVFIKL